MALINHRTREIHFKIVYYGPGLCGKTTNLKALHDKLPAERRGKLISIATDQERTLFFDFLPIDLGQVNGFLTRFHLYTVPGQVYYRLSRRAVLQGVDGIIFVADSHPAREAANRESLADLHEHLTTLGVTGLALARVPWVFQWNKRDLAHATPVERLQAALNPQGWPEVEAVANVGPGVSETLRAACKAVLARLGGAQVAPAGAALAAVGAAQSAAASVPAAPAAQLARPSMPSATPSAAPESAPFALPSRVAATTAVPTRTAAPRPAARRLSPMRPAPARPAAKAPAARPAAPFFARPSAPVAAPAARPRFAPLSPLRRPEEPR